MAEKAETLRPDMILVGLCLNDILVYSESGAISEAGAEWKGQRLAGTRRLSRFLLRHSQLYAFSYAQLKSAMYSASAHHGAMATDSVKGKKRMAPQVGLESTPKRSFNRMQVSG